MAEEKFRIEKDILGKVKVPFNAYYGNQTVRASENFPISGFRIHEEMNRALIQIKIAAAKANAQCGVLDNKISIALTKAGEHILKNYQKFQNQFIIDVYQAGAGTPWHMNANEVITNVALELSRKKKGDYKSIDPHDHTNMGQSTNGVIPTAMRISSIKLTDKLIIEMAAFIQELNKKGKQFKDLVKSGRTHLQDAVPITLGNEFTAWAADMEKRLVQIEHARINLYHLHIGGTAIGTGLNAHPRFSKLTVKNLRKQTGLHFSIATNKIEQTQFMGDFLDLSAALRTFAVDLNKIANDLRLLSSGPTTGLQEIQLPQVEPGSSIMPSKFNPSMAEMVNMVCYQVIGNDLTIEQATQAGQLELNVMTPVIAHNLLQSLDILTNGIREFNNRCVKNIKANKKILQEYFEKSPSVGTVLNPVIGYDKTAEVIREAINKNKSVKTIAVEKGYISETIADKLFSKKNFKL